MTLVDAIKLVGGMVGSFAAAWLGAHFAFRRTRKERGFDRVVDWHKTTIEALARYEEKLEALHNYAHNVLIVQRVRDRSAGDEQTEFPQTIKIPEKLWADLRDAEQPARAALRLADAYLDDLPTQVECSTALANTVNVVASQWLDISPNPEIAWIPIANRAIWVKSLRQKLQVSLRRVLALDSFLARVSPWLASRLLLRRIRKEQRKLSQGKS